MLSAPHPFARLLEYRFMEMRAARLAGCAAPTHSGKEVLGGMTIPVIYAVLRYLP
jgi:hypothetical protein